jgi:hypothetical protein
MPTSLAIYELLLMIWSLWEVTFELFLATIFFFLFLFATIYAKT